MKVIDNELDCVSFACQRVKETMSTPCCNDDFVNIKNYASENEPLKKRLNQLKELFYGKYNVEPEIYARVPGRVNLIGEHVDYCGYSVCPMAIDRDICIAASTVDGDGEFLKICNEENQYMDVVIDSNDFRISIEDGWHAYILCGIKGAMNILDRKSPVRMLMAVSGNIPPGSGLSSSSALVCASLLVTATLNKVQLNKSELAEISATCERYIGTEGGGMDQAIAFLASKGCAKHIQFNPIRTVDVKLPDELVFVIAHSLVTKNKAESSEFNTRVVECRLATQIMAKKCNLDWRKISKVADLQTALGCSLDKLSEIIKDSLHDGHYTKEEVCQLLEVKCDELEQVSLSENTRHLTSYLLKPRVTHVVSEAQRVNQWVELTSSDNVSPKELGCLMFMSHESMSRLYEAGHPECDRLVKICMEGPGCLGARITGAGWGGAVVAVTSRAQLIAFINHVQIHFYQNYEAPLEQVLFSTEPQQGALLFSN